MYGDLNLFQPDIACAQSYVHKDRVAKPRL